MVRDSEKDKKAIVEEVRTLRSKLSKLEPVEIKKAGRAEHMSVEDVLRAGDEKYRPLFDNMLDGFAYCKILLDENDQPIDFIYLDVNNAFEKLTGLKKEDVVGKKVTEAIPGIKEAHPDLFDIYGEVALTGKEAQFDIFFKPLEIWLSISVYSPGRGYFVALFENITERKKAEEEREVMIKLLSLINSSDGMRELMRLVMTFLRDWSDCEAVGIRLAEGEDYPYFVTSGFPEEFVLAENSLCSVNETGELVRDSQGRVFLECMCGNVISGRYDPSRHFFTRNGSFWTNSTTELLAGTTENDRLAKTRNRCNTAGYESVALIPLRTGQKTYGLLQFNDKQKGRFTPDRISLFERLADNLAIGLAQRKAEQALRETTQTLEAVIQASPLPIFAMDRERIVKTWNPAAERTFGWSAEEVIGGRYPAIPEDKKDEADALFSHAMESGLTEVETLRQRKDGSLIDVSISAAPLRDSSGNVNGVMAVITDITERKQAEQALRTSEAQLSEAVQIAKLGYWEQDVLNELFTFNDHFYKMLRTTADEVGGYTMPCEKYIETFIHPDDRERVKARCRDIFENPDTQSGNYLEHRIIYADGEVGHIAVHFSVVKDNQGRVIKTYGANQDITERKQAEQALRDSEQRLKAALDAAEMGIWDWDLISGKITWAGHHARLFGYKEEDFDGSYESFAKRAHPEDLPILNAAIEKSRRDKTEYLCEYRVIWPDGSVHWIQGKGRYRYDDKGQAVRMLGVVKDITERKKAEKKLARLNKVLKTIAAVNEDIFLIRSRHELLERVCQRIVEYAYRLVWIGFCDEKTKRIVPEAQAGFEEGYLETVKITYDQTEYGKGPTGTAVRTGKPGVMRFITTDPAYEPWREKALKRGYRSSAAIPIFGTDEVIGALNVYADKEDAFGDEEIKLLEELAHDISTGLRAIDEETGRERAEEKLQESEIRFRELFDSMSSGVAVYEAIGDGEDFVFKDMNGAGEQIDRVSRADVIGRKVTEVFPGVKELGLFEVFQRVWRTGRPEYYPRSLYKDERLAHWVENYVYKLPSGEIVTVYNDVTERKAVEEKLREYQHQLKSMASQLSQVHEQERRSLAVEMHERVSQRLAMAKVNVQILAQSSADAEISDKLRSTAEEIGRVIEDAYSLVLELSNPVLYEVGLKAAIEALLRDRIRPECGIEYELAADDDDLKLEDVIKVPVYQAVRELLTNVIKHSRASKVVVDIHRTRDVVQVVVKDNGVGFDLTRTGAPVAGKEGGFGLFGIRENLEYINGKLEVKSEQGKGTVAIVTAPLEYKAEPGLGGQRP